MQDAPAAPVAEPTEAPKTPGRFDRKIQAQMLMQEAERIQGIATQQAQQAEVIGNAHPWITDRYARAAKANKSLATALADHARKLAA